MSGVTFSRTHDIGLHCDYTHRVAQHWSDERQVGGCTCAGSLQGKHTAPCALVVQEQGREEQWRPLYKVQHGVEHRQAGESLEKAMCARG